MKYFSHYYWESSDGENPISVILQQVKLRKGRCLLACICDGSKSSSQKSLVSGYFTERLVEWFHQKFIPAKQKGLQENSIFRMLTEEMKQIEEELQEYEKQKGIVAVYDILGMILCEQFFCCFGQGGCKGFLFNQRFNKKQRRNLKGIMLQPEEDRRIQVVQGSLQKGIGILLCSALYDTEISEEEMVEVLSEEHLQDKDIQKRLKELWKENQKRGECGNAGAIFFRTE